MNIDLPHPFPSSRESALDELALKHQKIAEKYRHCTEVPTHPDVDSLVAFNGYYLLEIEGVNGAFLTVDTNMHKHPLIDTPIFDVELIVCLDGEHPVTIAFEGPSANFDGAVLTYGDPADPFSPLITLIFTRPTQDQEVMAAVAGTVQLHTLETPVAVVGYTYNNPIPYETYVGSYHAESENIPGAAVCKIAPGYQLSYRFEGADSLAEVSTFTYNLNMYYFSFDHADNNIRLIMGAAPGRGLVSNNITTDRTTGKLVSQRSIQTTYIGEDINFSATPNSNSEALGLMSGYYPLPLAEGAFVCIQGRYNVTANSAPVYEVRVGISTDGFSSKVYLFDDNMSWENNLLTMNIPDLQEPLLNAVLTRSYQGNGSFGTLTALNGTVLDGEGIPFAVSSVNFLNPVPLQSFGGATLTNSTGPTTLTVDGDFQVTYNGTPILDLTYVPMMYVAAFKNPEHPQQTILLSFGTNGPKGVACIITDVISEIPPDLVITGVWALPDASEEKVVPQNQIGNEQASAVG